jgi:hypothetical protein
VSSTIRLLARGICSGDPSALPAGFDGEQPLQARTTRSGQRRGRQGK